MQVNLLQAEHNADMMLLAARALTFLADVMPASAAAIVRHGAVQVQPAGNMERSCAPACNLGFTADSAVACTCLGLEVQAEQRGTGK